MTVPRKVSMGQRRQMIAEAAYFLAEKRGFDGGDPAEDWYAAEGAVDARLRELEAQHVLGALDEALSGATRRLAALKRRLSGVSLEARTELQKDADRLGELRDTLKLRLGELKERGERAGRRLREEGQALAVELRELLQKPAPRRKPSARKRASRKH
jgi:Protein of unknown function (DUF2934)